MSNSYHEQFRNNLKREDQTKAKTNGKIAFGTKIPPARPAQTQNKFTTRSDVNRNGANQNESNVRSNRDHSNGAVQRSANVGRIPSSDRQIPYEQPPPPPARPANNNIRKVPPRRGEVASDYDDNIRRPLRLPPSEPRHSITKPPSNRAPVEPVYTIERRQRQPPAPYAYDDYSIETPVEKRPKGRILRIVRDQSHYNNPNADYYDEPENSEQIVYETIRRRKPIERRATPTEYVYVDEPVPRRRRAPARRPEIVYVDDDRPADDYAEEYYYVDEDGNEVEVIEEPMPAPARRVRYVYDDEYDGYPREQRRSRPAKMVYVDEPERNIRKSKPAGSTRIIYD